MITAISPYQNAVITDTHVWLGKTQSAIKHILLRLNYQFTVFLHWLMIPELDLILQFSHQVCVNVLNAQVDAQATVSV